MSQADGWEERPSKVQKSSGMNTPHLLQEQQEGSYYTFLTCLPTQHMHLVLLLPLSPFLLSLLGQFSLLLLNLSVSPGSELDFLSGHAQPRSVKPVSGISTPSSDVSEFQIHLYLPTPQCPWSTADIPNFTPSSAPPNQLCHCLLHLSRWQHYLHRKFPCLLLVGQKSGPHMVRPSCTFRNWSSLTPFFFLHTLYLIHQEVLAPSSEYIQNLTDFHHLYCYHPIHAIIISHMGY